MGLWLGDGAGWPDFMPGDSISEITGRGYNLGQSFGGRTVYPEIVQVNYLPDAQSIRRPARSLMDGVKTTGASAEPFGQRPRTAPQSEDLGYGHSRSFSQASIMVA